MAADRTRLPANRHQAGGYPPMWVQDANLGHGQCTDLTKRGKRCTKPAVTVRGELRLCRVHRHTRMETTAPAGKTDQKIGPATAIHGNTSQ